MLLRDHLYGRVVAAAPSYLLLEVLNALRKYIVRGVIGGSDARKACRLLVEAEVELHSIDAGLAGEALDYSLARGVTVYDAYYIVLARRLGAVFYTADEKLLERLKSVEPRVRHVAEYKRH